MKSVIRIAEREETLWEYRASSNLVRIPDNWLQVLGPAELAQIDQRVRHQLHPIVPLLDTFKSEQEPLELIFPRESPFDTHPQCMDSFIEEPLPSTFRGFAIELVASF